MTTQTQAERTDPWRPDDTLASRLILVRHHLHLSQREAAVRTGVTYGEWQSMENGRAARDLPRKVVAIAQSLGVDRDWLMWGGALNPGGGPTSQYLAESVGPAAVPFARSGELQAA